MYEITSTCKGGGYIYCRTNPPHPKRNSKGLYPLHRVVMENKLGRALLPGEDVHHKDEDKSNNADDNLEVLTKTAHGALHHQPIPAETAVCKCGKAFELKPRVRRTREGRNKDGAIYCSRSCGARFTNQRRTA